MKKFLFGTTALAAVGFAVLAAAPANAQTAPAPGFRSNGGFTIGISGYARQYVGMAETKNGAAANRDGVVDTNSDWRPIFNFAMPLANGMTAGAVLQFNPLNNTTNSTSVTRRQWSFVSGAFGQVQVGMADGVAAQMNVGGNEMFTGGAVKNAGKIYDFTSNPNGNFASRSIVATTNADMFDNGRPANKINYFSPRFAGFQIGGSYAPSNSSGIDGSPEVQNTQYHNIYSVAANYLNTFDGIAVRAYAGYLTAQGPGGWTNSAAVNAFHKDPRWMGFGAGVGFMGWDLGLSYADLKDGRIQTQGTTTAAAALGTVTNDGKAWEAGLNYTFGAYGVGVNYFIGKNKAGTSDAAGAVVAQPFGDDKRTGYSVSGRYVMGPGVNLEAILFTIKNKTGAATAASAFNPSNRETKANGAVTALILAF